MILSTASLEPIGSCGDTLSQTRPLPSVSPVPRVLVFGSRKYRDLSSVERELSSLWVAIGTFHLVHGGCPTGPDYYADRWYKESFPGVQPEVHAADWSKYGRAAGPIRNTEMAASKPDYALGWVLDSSDGSTDMYDKLGDIPAKVTWIFSTISPGFPKETY